MKLSKHVETQVIANDPIPVQGVRDNQDQSAATSPRSDNNVNPGCGFRPYHMEQFVNPGGFNMCPYFVYPIFQFY